MKQIKNKKNEIRFLTPLLRGKGKAKWSKTGGELFMRFKEPTNSEQL